MKALDDFVSWSIHDSIVDTSVKVNVRFRALVFSDSSISVAVYVNNVEVEKLELNPIHRWALTEPVYTNLVFLPGAANTVGLKLLADCVAGDYLLVDFLELYHDGSNINSHFFAYDVDRGDSLTFRLMNGMVVENVNILKLSHGPSVPSGHSVIYTENVNANTETFFQRPAQSYLGVRDGSTWCQPRHLPCLGWSKLALSADMSPIATPVTVYAFQRSALTSNQINAERSELIFSLFPTSNDLITGTARFQCWVKVSEDWNGTLTEILSVKLWSVSGDAFVSPFPLQISSPLDKNAWSLEYVDIYLGDEIVQEATVTVGNGQARAGVILFFDLKLFHQQSLLSLHKTGHYHFDFENVQHYQIEVEAQDGHGMKAHKYIRVNVLDVNEPPIFLGQQSFFLSEDAAMGTHVGTIYTSDPDSSQEWGIQSHDILIVMEGPQYLEMGATVTSDTEGAFTLVALENPSEIKQVQLQWDARFSPTKIYLQTSSSAPNAEHVRWTSSFGWTLDCSNNRLDLLDLPEESMDTHLLNFTFSGYCDSSATIKLDSLRIVGTNSFELKSDGKRGVAIIMLRDRGNKTSPLSYNNHPVYALRVLVVDGPGLSMEADVSVAILDSNEPPIVGFDMSVVPFRLDNVRYVMENAKSGEFVGHPVHGYDHDPNQAIFYSVESFGTGYVHIQQCTGQLLASKMLLNFENIQRFNVTVTLVDNDKQFPLSDTVTLYIKVKDANEPPVLLTESLDCPENIWRRDPDKIIGNRLVSNNSQLNGSVHVFYLLKNASNVFRQNEWLKIEQSSTPGLNEVPFQVLSVPAGTNSSFAVLLKTPVGDQSVATGLVRRLHTKLETYNAQALSLQAVDPDNEGVNTQKQTLAYNLVGNLDVFEVDVHSGKVILLRPVLNFETQSTYTINVAVGDNGIIYQWIEGDTNGPGLQLSQGETLSSEASVQVNVIDLNDFPKCPDMTLIKEYYVSENSAKGTILSFNNGIYEATDEDNEMHDLEYSIHRPGSILGRLFATTKHGDGCSQDRKDILRGGNHFGISLDKCRSNCVAREDCASWEHNSTSCTLFRTVPVCPPGREICFLHNHSLPEASQTDSTCGYLKRWHMAKNHACTNGTVEPYVSLTDVFSTSACETKCAAQYPSCKSWDFVQGPPHGYRCRLFAASATHMANAHFSTCGFFRQAEHVHPYVFGIDPATGVQAVNNSLGRGVLNYEYANYYAYTVVARDKDVGSISCEGSVVVRVQDLNEPIRLYKDAFMLNEILDGTKGYEDKGLGPLTNGFRSNEIPMAVLGWDEDASSTLSFAVSGGPFGISTCLTCAPGQLFLAGDFLDFETKNQYSLIVTATDYGDPIHQSSQVITVNVLDNGEAPELLGLSKARYLVENSNIGDPVQGAPLKCSDQDSNEILTWFIPSFGSVASTFLNPCGEGLPKLCNEWPKSFVRIPDSVNAGSEYSLTLVAGALAHTIDYESMRSFSFLIAVRDSSNVKVEGTVDISILDENESPTFSPEAPSTIFFPASAPTGVNIGTAWSLLTSDPEGGSLLFSFYCTSASPCTRHQSNGAGQEVIAPSDFFDIHPRSGQITLSSTLPLVGGEEFRFNLRVADFEGESCISSNALCGNGVGGITVKTVLDNAAPSFASMIPVSIPENAMEIDHVHVRQHQFDTIATVHMKHALEERVTVGSAAFIFSVPSFHRVYDTNIGSYAAISGGASLNSVDNVAKIVLAHPPPTNTSFSYLAVGTLEGKYVGGTLGWIIVDTLYALDENLLCGDLITACTKLCQLLPCVTNPLNPQQRLHFKQLDVQPSWAKDMFDVIITGDIDGVQQRYGVIVKGAFNYEAQNTVGWDHMLTITIEVEDCPGCSSSLSGVTSMFVFISDVAEPPHAPNALFNTQESNVPQSPVGEALVVTDPDGGNQANFVLTSPLFPISIDTISGQFYLRAALDAELKIGYGRVVIVQDSYHPKLLTHTHVIINILNDNEPPKISSQDADIIFPEDVAVGYHVTTIKVFDEDFSTVLDCRIIGGEHFEDFIMIQIEGQPFEYKIFSYHALDYENHHEYQLTIAVRDNEGLTETTVYTIELTDVNDITVDDIQIIDPVYGNRPTMATRGGQIIRVAGSNLGVIDNPESKVFLAFSNAHVATDSEMNSGNISSCARLNFGARNSIVECESIEGHGSDHRWTVYVQRVDGSGKVWKHVVNPGLTISYSNPSISSVFSSALLDTRGMQNVTLMGTNFGGMGRIARVVEYGPDGYGLCATGCTVKEPHTAIVCLSSPGHGIQHSWTIRVGHNRESTASTARTSYKAPSVHFVSYDVPASSGLDTRGYVANSIYPRVIVTGSSFGLGVVEWNGCGSPEKYVAAPKLKFYYKNEDAANITYEAINCELTVPHQKALCEAAPGAGKGHYWFASIAGVRGGSSSNSTSYKEPVIFGISGPGATQGNTIGGQNVYVSGDFFGPSGFNLSIEVSYGQYPNAWKKTGKYYPPYIAVCAVTVNHVEMTCKTDQGTGANHSWLVSVARQTPLLGYFHAGTSYGPPIIYEIVNENNFPLLQARTQGRRRFLIKGNNFGPPSRGHHATVSYSRDSIEYTATGCNISKPHVEIQCRTVPGAGTSYALTLYIDEQKSVVASTSYGLPEITNIYGAASNGIEDGNETVFLEGKNFGPSTNFIDAVTYGETGKEYKAECINLGHSLLTCKTAAGVGQNLLWSVMIMGQSNIVSNTTSSYALPNILHSVPTVLGTQGPFIVELHGSNFGLLDSAPKPASILVEISHANSVEDVEIIRWDGNQHLSYVETFGRQVVSFQAPPLQCAECLAHIKVRMKLVSYSGVEMFSNYLEIPFEPPVIETIYVIGGITATSRRLQVRGMGFGAAGDVFVRVHNQSESKLPQHGASPLATGSYVVSYGHKAVDVEFAGFQGALLIRRAGESSALMEFSQMSPEILSDHEGTLFMKSDLMFSDQETLGFESLGYIPSQCRYIGFESDPACLFFDVTYNSRSEDLNAPNVAAHPLVFQTGGYNNDSSTGHIIFLCRNCGAGFTESQTIDLRVFVGEDNSNRKECIIVPPTIYDTQMDTLQVRCQVPPGETGNVPIQLRWGSDLSPTYPIAYRQPSIDEVTLVGRNSSTQRFAKPLSKEDMKVCTMDASKGTQCACRFYKMDCEGKQWKVPCVWSPISSVGCVISLFSTGQNVSVLGKNFGTSIEFISLFWGDIALPVYSYMNRNDGTYEVLGGLPEGMDHTVRYIAITVAGQSSEPSETNLGSKIFPIRYGSAEISRLDLGQNTRTAGGSLAYVQGINFGNVFSYVQVLIGGRRAEVKSVHHESITLLVTEGQGKGRQIVVVVLNETTKPSEQTFDYSPPSIDGILNEDIQNFPTSGRNIATNEPVKVLIFGDNFGTGEEIEVLFGDRSFGMVAVPTEVGHTQVNFSLPAGDGVNLTVFIRVSNQTGWSSNFNVSYAPPQIYFVSSSSGSFPPSGCNKFHDNVVPPAVGLVCRDPTFVLISGVNFGRKHEIFFHNTMTGQSSAAEIVNSSHVQAVVKLFPGVAKAAVALATIGSNRDTFSRVSNAITFNYSRPRLDGVVFGQSIDTAVASNTYDAQGGELSGGLRLYFLGEHFGERETALQIVLGGQECMDPVHHGWSQPYTLKHQSINPGRPYLSCIPQETDVGPKEIIIHVAYVVGLHESPSHRSRASRLFARCFPNYYGLVGEHCVECWHYESPTKYRQTVGGNLKTYAAVCDGMFDGAVGNTEPYAKPGFSLLPPPACMFNKGCLL